MTPKILMAAAFGCALLSGCTTGPRIVAEAPTESDAVPTDAPVEIAETRRSGPQMNAIGGEIPNTAPTVPVGEGAIEEARPG